MRPWSAGANLQVPESTRPIVEVFFHARYFLEMVCKYRKLLT